MNHTKVKARISQPRVPKGYMLVPIEPTRDMMIKLTEGWSGYERYKAMLDVTPEYTGKFFDLEEVE